MIRPKQAIQTSFLWWFMVVLSLAGLGVSAYLMWGYTVPGASLSCGGGQGCDAVKNSVYANLVGIPMPLIGLASYLLIFGFLIFQQGFVIKRPDWTPYFALAIFCLSLMGILYSAYLTYIELFVIYAICRWCVASAVIMTILFPLSIFNLYYLNQGD